MTLFVLTDASGIEKTGDIDSDGTLVDLVAIANETGIGVDPVSNGRRQVTYTRTLTGAPQLRLDALVNTTFQPDYGSGPQAVDVVVISVQDNFVLKDGSVEKDNGVTLPPSDSGLAGASQNPTRNCLIVYDTQIDLCGDEVGSGSTFDLPFPGPSTLYHELSHAWRIVRNAQLSLAAGACPSSSDEERAAIDDENDMRTQLAALAGTTPVLRDPGDHCGGPCGTAPPSCCIVASLVSGSARSTEVNQLRTLRDRFLRPMEIGHEFFEQLHYDYYAFSPQVCTMIAGDPPLQKAVLHGIVEPLLEFWRFVTVRAAAGETSDAELGALHLAQLPPAAERPERLRRLERVRDWWSGRPTGDPVVPDELLRLLQEQAWPRRSIQWAVIEPLRMQHAALVATLEGGSPDAVGRVLRTMLDRWSPELPITPVWGALASSQLDDELAVCDQGLFVTAAARHAFRRNLVRRFPAVTAIRKLAGRGEGSTP